MSVHGSHVCDFSPPAFLFLFPSPSLVFSPGSNKLICFHLSMPVMLLLGFHGLQTGQPAEWGPPNKRRKPQGVPALGFGYVPVEAVTLLITVMGLWWEVEDRR